MTDEQVQRMLQAVRDAAETLNGEGYHTAMHAPTQAALDIRFLLSHFDRPQLNPDGCAILVGQWVKDGTYRSVVHRHDGSYVAADESERKFVRAGTLPLLADALMNWPTGAEPLPPERWVKLQ